MAKGLGAILAQGKMYSDQVGVKSAPGCPMCGQPMELEMGGWFCRSERDERTGDGRPCLSLIEAQVVDAFLDDTGERRWIDDFQGATLAAIVQDGRMVVEFITIRGAFGRTNIRLWSDIPTRDLPEFCAGKEWVWMDWAYPFSAEARNASV